MTLNEDFIAAVEEHRMWAVYQRLADILSISSSLERQDEMLRYAESRLPDLYQDHDGEELDYNENKWTDEYYKDQKWKLEKNFSKDRLALLRRMAERKYEKEKIKKMPPEVIVPMAVGGAVAVGGIVTVCVGIGIGSMPITALGAAVAVVGGVIVVVYVLKK
jgi:hypothetical protein